MTAVEQLRYHRRLKAASPAAVKAGGHTLAGTVRDISLGGLFVVTDAALHNGTEVEVVLIPPDELGVSQREIVCCHGKVMRTENVSGQFGIAVAIERFDAPSDQERY